MPLRFKNIATTIETLNNSPLISRPSENLHYFGPATLSLPFLSIYKTSLTFANEKPLNSFPLDVGSRMSSVSLCPRYCCRCHQNKNVGSRQHQIRGHSGREHIHWRLFRYRMFPFREPWKRYHRLPLSSMLVPGVLLLKHSVSSPNVWAALPLQLLWRFKFQECCIPMNREALHELLAVGGYSILYSAAVGRCLVDPTQRVSFICHCIESFWQKNILQLSKNINSLQIKIIIRINFWWF